MKEFVSIESTILETALALVNGGKPIWTEVNKFFNDLLPEGSPVVIDSETGEIIENATVTTALYDVAYKTFWNKYHQIKNGKGPDERGYFIQMYRNFHISLEGRLTNAQRSKLLELFLCVDFEDKPLIWNGNPMTAQDIADYWGMNLKNTKKHYLTPFCKEDKENGIEPILYTKKQGKYFYYYFNSKAIFKGKNGENEYFIKVFQNKLKEVIKKIKDIEEENEQLQGKKRTQFKSKSEDKTKRRASALGVLYSLMPWAHFQTYFLVSNPTMTITDEETLNVEQARLKDQTRRKRKHKLLLMSKIAKIVANGESKMRPNILREHLKTLNKAKAIMLMELEGKTAILMHPWLVFAADSDGKDSYTMTRLADFGEEFDIEDNGEENNPNSLMFD